MLATCVIRRINYRPQQKWRFDEGPSKRPAGSCEVKDPVDLGGFVPFASPVTTPLPVGLLAPLPSSWPSAHHSINLATDASEPAHAETAEPIRVAPPKAVAYLCELGRGSAIYAARRYS